ncbi:hypothetical protein I3842_15G142800 [Carya illinoinensis]|uniref:TIR domain-containing protein n=1 Tax=Carya illinoinensis TaxID=32201 RepID=A0A922ADT1_CARIL|nr:hypothetical protein I3842_15G142800 [Carya illinoinensis]
MAFQLGASSSFSPSSSPSIRSWNHDVFLSFRGEDVRNNFISHLYKALVGRKINTYIDNNLERGEEISPALFKAIEGSMISIIVLSENYAESKWCLDELLKILDCKETIQQIVLPIFFKVDPSEVRHQKGIFGRSFDKLGDKLKDNAKMLKWKKALEKVANFSGFPSANFRDESECIQKIVEQVSSKLPNRTRLHVADHPVGLESRAEDIINTLLGIEIINETRMIGIFGIGGIGKTTTAKEVYNRIANKFEGSCFLANVSENSKPDKGGQVKLQEKILSNILRVDPKVEVNDVDQGIILIQEKLCCKKILLILDDVDDLDQLKYLSGRSDWFGLGSRIIVTTRDAHLLVQLDFGNWKTYSMNTLDSQDALKLFSWHAFKRDQPDNDFVELTKLAMQYAGGLPLALIVVGSNLRGRNRCFWESELEKYERIQHKKIYDILKISFDGLDDYIKKIFLDIAFFFKGNNRDYVTKILDGCGFFANAGIINLIDKSLITIDEDDELMMHDLIEDMGREIVRQESPEEPGKRSRLCFHDDVRELLERNKGTEQIEGILIDRPWKDRGIRLGSKDMFAKMEKLRILIVRSDTDSFCGGLNYLSNELRVLNWFKCPLKFLPSSFHGEKLIDFSIEQSNIRDLGTRLQSKNLTIMDLSFCKYLTNISGLSSCSNLEKLFLCGCKSLVEVHDSVGFLDKLVELDFSYCSSLKKLPRSFKLRSLELLELDDCTSLENFPEIECEMKYLKDLSLESTEIQELPSSITYLTGLETLYINECISLVHFPVNIFQLEHLRDVSIINCPNFANFGKESFLPESNNSLSHLRILNLSGSGIVSLPPCIEGFVGLSKLDLRDCKQLEEILRLPLNIEEVDARGCSSLKRFLPELNNSLSRWRIFNLSGSGIVSLPPCIEGFVGLSKLDLRDCKQLEKILGLPLNIEEVDARGCSSLKSFLPESNNSLSRLRIFNLSGSGIVSLPPCIEGFVGLSKLDLRDCKQLEEILRLPLNIEEVDARGCSSLKSFLPESNNSLSRLRIFNLSGSGIVSLPPCIEGFVGLSKLDLSDCKQLEEILRLPLNIEEVDVTGCSSLKSFLPESNNSLSRLRELKLYGSGVVSLPPCIEGSVGLSKLDLRDCKQLEEILGLPLNIEEVDARGCSSLKSFLPESNNSLSRLRELKLCGSGIVSLPPCIEGSVGLSELDLRDCKQLQEILRLPLNIEEVDARGCSSLKSFLPESNNNLSRLRELKLCGSGVVSLPPCIEGSVGLSELDLRDCKQLEEILCLPPNIKEVNARGCSSLKNFLPKSNNLSWTYNFSSSLRTLNLFGSGIVSLPSCIKGFVGLSELDLRYCKQLEEILHLPPNIKEVDARGCVEQNCFSTLKELDLSSSDIVSLPKSIKRVNGLKQLRLEDCRQLQEILELPPNIEEMYANGCISLERFPEVSRKFQFNTCNLRAL